MTKQQVTGIKEKPVLVTTKHRGVFFGFLEGRKSNFVVLKEARCAIKWSTTGGFLELADKGPNRDSRVGNPAPRLELFDVTSVADVRPEAVAAWTQ